MKLNAGLRLIKIPWVPDAMRWNVLITRITIRRLSQQNEGFTITVDTDPGAGGAIFNYLVLHNPAT
jgi:hypothetical protein